MLLFGHCWVLFIYCLVSLFLPSLHALSFLLSLSFALYKPYPLIQCLVSYSLFHFQQLFACVQFSSFNYWTILVLVLVFFVSSVLACFPSLTMSIFFYAIGCDRTSSIVWFSVICCCVCVCACVCVRRTIAKMLRWIAMIHKMDVVCRTTNANCTKQQ